ncbi:unnamed protein product [Rotaria magnacalcarata]|uniref:Envelope protein n=1 Tax=Rotaria magnacalcarata TaxID=392030 RepID=A0A816VUA9_9BILA|nr:unnamed protein product [Rotaria magnacalcarata]CAF4226554.1 unnamed protein product [Rotaria magnacalcarata]
MQNYVIIPSFLLILFIVSLHAYSNITFSKDTIIAYPETGLFLDYVGLYTPAEAIIHNSAIFTMTVSSCYFLPLSAAENIPSCNITTKRSKREIAGLASLAIASASLGMSISNSIQIDNLQKQMGIVESSLSTLSQTVQIHGAKLAKLTLKHIELAQELDTTQEVISEMMPILYDHSVVINDLKNSLHQLHIELQHSFLYLAISRIYHNELTLEFLTPEDIQKVVYNVIERGNLTFKNIHGSIPVVRIITKLLVRQQIDFIPRSQYKTGNIDEICRLVITSYFAIPRPNQTPFYTYKLVAVPVFHEKEAMQLAHIPRYWAFNPVTNTSIEWQSPQEFGCDLQLMTSCRDTPPIRKILRDTCFDEIIERRPLSKCQTIPITTHEHFVQHLRDNFWITSSPEPMRCMKTSRIEHLNVVQHIGSTNEEIVLPSVSLVNVTEGYAVLCPGFILLGRPLISNVTSLVILRNNTISSKNISVMNIHKYITGNMTWFKKTMTEHEKNELMDYKRQIDNIRNEGVFFPTYTRSFGLLSVSGLLFGLSFILLYFVYRQCVYRFKRRKS